MTEPDQKSDAKVMPKKYSKTDVRYWNSKIFRRKRNGSEDVEWTAQIQHLKRREQFPLGTANAAVAAAKARDIYLSVYAKGWDETLLIHKPKPVDVIEKQDQPSVGDLIRCIQESTTYRQSTLAVYCIALRKIAADIAGIVPSKKRFAPGGKGNEEWRKLVEDVPLSVLTEEAIHNWKLGYLKIRSRSNDTRGKAINSMNAHLRNARSLFTEKALEIAAKKLALPAPVPFSSIKLERRSSTTRYSSRIDASKLVACAWGELNRDPARKEQFKIFCLALLCGLRKREIDTLLWKSVDLEKAVIRIEPTQYFEPKTLESAGDVDLSPQLVAFFREARESSKGQFVIESNNPPRYATSRTNYRAEKDFQALYSWLDQKGVSSRKKLHELRKECGSVIAQNAGIFAASRALRHSDIRITSHYYTDKKVPITTGLEVSMDTPPVVSKKRVRLKSRVLPKAAEHAVA